MINKKESSKLQKSWNYRQINESYSQDRKHLLRLFIPIIIFLLILGNIYRVNRPSRICNVLSGKIKIYSFG